MANHAEGYMPKSKVDIRTAIIACLLTGAAAAWGTSSSQTQIIQPAAATVEHPAGN